MRSPPSPPGWLAARLLVIRPDALVLDKPPGLPMDGGRRGAASLRDWLPLLAMGKRRPPEPAHRLDADTAGCVILARTRPALAALGALFAARRVVKGYWAVVEGEPPGEAGVAEAPLRKVSTRAGGWRVEAHPAGLEARTRWRVLGRGGGLAWVACRPETGRTHQIRVHLAGLGCPILGDPVYGRGGAGAMHLLARSVSAPLEPPLAAEAPVPAEMAGAFGRLGTPDAVHEFVSRDGAR